MVELQQKSYLRDAYGPRAVESSNGKDKSRIRRRKDRDHRDRHHSKSNDSHRAAKKDSAHRRKRSTTTSAPSCIEQPSLQLDVVLQPLPVIQLGMTIETSVLISLFQSLPEQSIKPRDVDTSSLFTVVSLISTEEDQQKIPLEAGSVSGQKLFDSVHPMPTDGSYAPPQVGSLRAALGYCSFPQLLIREAGTFRLRVTLIKTGGSLDDGATSLQHVDSEPVKVEKRHETSYCRRQLH